MSDIPVTIGTSGGRTFLRSPHNGSIYVEVTGASTTPGPRWYCLAADWRASKPDDFAPVMEPLSPCPFDGSEDVFVERADYSASYVFCNACGAHGPTCNAETDDDDAEGESAARRSWNRRSSSTVAAPPPDDVRRTEMSDELDGPTTLVRADPDTAGDLLGWLCVKHPEILEEARTSPLASQKVRALVGALADWDRFCRARSPLRAFLPTESESR